MTGDISGVNRRMTFFMHKSRKLQINVCNNSTIYDYELPKLYLHVKTHPEWDDINEVSTLQVPMTFKIKCGYEFLSLM